MVRDTCLGSSPCSNLYSSFFIRSPPITILKLSSFFSLTDTSLSKVSTASTNCVDSEPSLYEEILIPVKFGEYVSSVFTDPHPDSKIKHVQTNNMPMNNIHFLLPISITSLFSSEFYPLQNKNQNMETENGFCPYVPVLFIV